ncbi:hypothetical protein COO60DRAFT_1089964 [Scenedesmus sp. NREL 46B-D3]|nr:hypothetical protein COO60DRAFT_1089964 [Scenedesmus sp. NREL 46B-D3]
MDDPTALFRQYETDYCNKSTDISRKITSIASLTGGAQQHCWRPVRCILQVAFLVFCLPSLRYWQQHVFSTIVHGAPGPHEKGAACATAAAELRRKKVLEIEADVREADNVVSTLFWQCQQQQRQRQQQHVFGGMCVSAAGAKVLPLHITKKKSICPAGQAHVVLTYHCQRIRASAHTDNSALAGTAAPG